MPASYGGFETLSEEPQAYKTAASFAGRKPPGNKGKETEAFKRITRNRWGAPNTAISLFTAIVETYYSEIMCMWGIGMSRWVHCLWRSGGGVAFPGVGCELLRVGAGNQTQGHYKNTAL